MERFARQIALFLGLAATATFSVATWDGMSEDFDTNSKALWTAFGASLTALGAMGVAALRRRRRERDR